MAGGISSHFRFEQRHRGRGVLTLVISDYLACYRRRAETPRKLALLFLPRLLSNPELHATAMLRLAFAGPRFLLPAWRTILIAKHSIDIMPEIEIGPGLRLPHPFGITLGWATAIGSDVTILQGVTIGGAALPRDLRGSESGPHVPAHVHRPCPRIEDEVIIYPGSMVVGSITLGRGSVVSAQSWLDHDLEPGATHRGRR
jgi:serine O-acetyltransferase